MPMRFVTAKISAQAISAGAEMPRRGDGFWRAGGCAAPPRTRVTRAAEHDAELASALVVDDVARSAVRHDQLELRERFEDLAREPRRCWVIAMTS